MTWASTVCRRTRVISASAVASRKFSNSIRACVSSQRMKVRWGKSILYLSLFTMLATSSNVGRAKLAHVHFHLLRNVGQHRFSQILAMAHQQSTEVLLLVRWE